MNIFIEGLQGMGKTTLLQNIWKKHPGYQVYREGDYCPLELAWCTYMTQEEYEMAIGKYASLTKEIERWTTREGDRYVVSYTRIITDEPGFHKYMEQFEIWYQLMLAYLKESPYGKQHHISDFKDMIDHFKCRQNLELRIIREIAGDFGVILPAKKYGDENFIPEV